MRSPTELGRERTMSRSMAAGLALLVMAAGTTARSPAAPLQTAAAAAACVLSAYNGHDLEAERRCFAPDAVSVGRRGDRRPFDWDAEAGYRGFDAIVHARFRFEPQPATALSIEVRLLEDN